MSVELAGMNIADIAQRVIVGYDIRDENGQTLSDDLYIIRSGQLEDLGGEIAKQVCMAWHRLEQRAQEATDFQIHEYVYGGEPPSIGRRDNRFTLRFDNADEAAVFTGLHESDLIKIQSTIRETLKILKKEKQHARSDD